MRHYNTSLRDYGSELSFGRTAGNRRKGLRWVLLGSLTGLCLGLFALTSFDAKAIRVNELTLSIPEPATPDAAAPALSGEGVPEQALSVPAVHATVDEPVVPGTWAEITVQSG